MAIQNNNNMAVFSSKQTARPLSTVEQLSNGTKRPYSYLNASSMYTTSNTNVDVFNKSELDRPNASAAPHFTRASALTHPRSITASAISRRFVGDGEPPLRSEYSQRMMAASTPGPSQNPLLSLSHPSYGLPCSLVKNFESLGVHSIYPWQSACLLRPGLLSGEKNLVYTAPTGGGKSLVADLLMLKKIIDNPGAKAILVLPYVALVQEKLAWLRRLVDGVAKSVNAVELDRRAASKWQTLEPLEAIRVAGFFGGSKTKATWADVDIAVCTIEKANSLVNNAIEECNIHSLGIVVMDELHMLDDDHRGYIIELLATKLMTLKVGVQIVGMSATLSNIQVVAKWLDAQLYESTYRPIPIEEHLVYENLIYPASSSKEFLRTVTKLNSSQSQNPLEPIGTIAASEFPELKRPMTNAVVALAVETALSGYGALVFCGSRQVCQSISEIVARAMPDQSLIDEETLNHRLEVVSELRSLPVGLDSSLAQTIVKGVGFHHAGLTAEERVILASAYDRGYLKVIVATCSLAAGINLPARRVILHGARMGRDLVGPAMLRQMRGRAGRKGKDEIGETFLCCQKGDLEAVVALFDADLPPLESCLVSDKCGLTRALLEVIGTRLATTVEAIDEYVEFTLLHKTLPATDLSSMVVTTLQELSSLKLIKQEDDDLYEPTNLGQATVASGLTPEDGVFVESELQRAQQSFVLDTDLQIFYLFTPIQISNLSDIDWRIFLGEIDRLDESGLRAMQSIGVSPAFINRMAHTGGQLKEKTANEIQTARIYRRCYTAFQLRDLCNEMPLYTVALKYKVPRGSVQTLSQQCQGFAAGMVKFCQRMGWDMLALLLDHMSDRLRAGARADLLEMAKVTFVKSRTARIFWENGYRSVRALAEADPAGLVPILMLAQPRKLKLAKDDDERLKKKLSMRAETIVSSASRLWEQQMLVELED